MAWRDALTVGALPAGLPLARAQAADLPLRHGNSEASGQRVDYANGFEFANVNVTGIAFEE